MSGIKVAEVLGLPSLEPVEKRPATPVPSRAARERSRLRRSLKDFFRAGWHVLEPTTPFQAAKHLDVLCDHLQAQLEGWAAKQADPTFEPPIQNLLATLPPGTLKSRALVMASAWAWVRWPSLKMLATSGNPRLALRDSMFFRQVVTSSWYVETFRPTWQIRDDQDAKGALGNTAGGVRLALGWDARAVGEHVDWIQADDPHDPEQVESDATRVGVLEKWDGSWANRVCDLASSIRTGIAQRTHEQDWSAARIAEGWAHLDLPMLYEPDRECVTPLGKPDWRTVEGESIQPARFTPEVIDKERTRVRERRWATLYQGRPAPASGAMVKLADLRFWRKQSAPHVAARPKGCYAGPARTLPAMDAVVIAGDLAGGKLTTKGDFNALVAVGRSGADFYLLEFWVKRAGFPEVQAKVRELARRYPSAKKVIESAASGASLVASLESEIAGLVGQTAKGDKESRLESVLAFFEAGNFHLPDGAPGVDALVASLTTFPNAAHDDDVDAISLALSVLATDALEKSDTEWAELRIARWRAQRQSDVTPELDDEAYMAGEDLPPLTPTCWPDIRARRKKLLEARRHEVEQRRAERAEEQAGWEARNAPEARCDRCRDVPDIEDVLAYLAPLDRATFSDPPFRVYEETREHWMARCAANDQRRERERREENERARRCVRCRAYTDDEIRRFIHAGCPHHED